MKRSLRRYWRGVAAISVVRGVVWRARVSVAVSALGAAVAALPAQSREALQVLAEDVVSTGGWAAWLRVVLLVASTLYLALLSWYFARWMLVRTPLDGPWRPMASGWQRGMSRHLPRLCFAVPLLGIAWAALSTARAGGPGAGVLGLLAAALVVAAAAGYPLLGTREGRFRRRHPGQGWGWNSRVLVVAAAVWVVSFIVFSTRGVQLASRVGPLAILLFCFGSWIAPGSVLAAVGTRLRVPVLGLLFGLAAMFSILNWNDNHAIRRTASAHAPDWSPPDLQEWLAHRPDAGDHDPYPVFVVAAEGGGLRAAYLTAAVLSAIQDRCPAFAHHLYAVSGVSGGSLGAAVFAALLARQERERAARSGPGAPVPVHADSADGACAAAGANPGPMQSAADSILRRDFLSPVLAAGLYPDFLQRFLPHPFPVLDRARALERGVETAWAETTGGSQMAAPVDALWRDAGGSVPLLLLNTTEVETGASVPADRIESPDSARRSMPLSTAAILSARFPLITPAGRAPAPRAAQGTARHARRYVDGGYFENSGTSALLELLQRERDAFRSRRVSAEQHCEGAVGCGPIEYEVIVIRIGTRLRAVPPAAAGLGETLSPVRAMFNTRDARGSHSIAMLEAYVDRSRAEVGGNRFITFELCDARAQVPLGWLLSHRSRAAMAKEIQSGEACEGVETSMAESMEQTLASVHFAMRGRF